MTTPTVILNREKLRIEMCKRSFEYFIRQFWECIPGVGDLKWNWHIGAFAKELQEMAERVFAGEPKKHNLVCNVCFGTSKSLVFSVLFPAWCWTRMPTFRFIFATHTDSLVQDLASRSRDIIISEKYKKYFPTIKIRNDKNSKEDYQNNYGGERKSCTVGGKSPTGRHAHAIIIDDPLDPKGARSEAELETAHKFMTETIPSRMTDKEVTPIILVMQRLRPRDPTDVMIDIAKKEGTTPLRRICFPGEITDGAAEVLPPEYKQNYIDGLMDPVRLSRRVLDDYRGTLGSYAYSGQVLQNPVPPGGGRFKPGWFLQQDLRAAPFASYRILYVDRAATAEGGCYTAMVLMAMDSDKRLYVEHVVHGQWEPNERNDRIVAEAKRCRNRYGPKHEPMIVIEKETGSTGKEAFQGLARRLMGYRICEDAPSGSKDVRAEPWADQLAAMNVWIINDKIWDMESYITEHILFQPDTTSKRMGRYKDQVDASCLISGTYIETINGQKRIEAVRAGDYVLTSEGYKEVEWAGQTGNASEIVSVLFSNGAIVSGTPDHLIWTENRGWIFIDTCRGTDYNITRGLNEEIKRCQKLEYGSLTSRESMFVGAGVEDISKSRHSIEKLEYRTTLGDILEERLIRKQSSSMGCFLTEDRDSDILLGEGERILCTERSGVSIMETSPMAATSIIRTKTGMTIRLRILNVLLKKNMLEDIKTNSELLNSSLTWRELERRLLSGIDQKKGECGTVSMRELLWLRRLLKESMNAFSAEKSFCLDAQDVEMEDILNTAPLFAETDIDIVGDMVFRIKNVSNAEDLSLESEELNAVLESAVPCCDGKISVPVYDLKVKEIHEFFANGILVHNSGALKYLISSVPQGRGRVYPFSGGKHPGQIMKLVSCPPDLLKGLMIDDHTCLLVLFQEPLLLEEDKPIIVDEGAGGCLSSLPEEGGMSTDIYEVSRDAPLHSLGKCLDTLTLTCLDIEPKDYQDTWESPIPGYGLPPEQLMFSRDLGKRLWNFVLKRRDPPWEVIVFSGSGNLPLSAAMGVSSGLGLSPGQAVYDAATGGEGINLLNQPAPNDHVYQMIKTTRGLVIG